MLPLHMQHFRRLKFLQPKTNLMNPFASRRMDPNDRNMPKTKLFDARKPVVDVRREQLRVNLTQVVSHWQCFPTILSGARAQKISS